MLLKRHFQRPEGYEPIRNDRDASGRLRNPNRAPGALLNPTPFDHIEIKHTGLTAEQNFSTRLVEKGQEEGWIRIEDGKLLLYGEPETLIYTIVRRPGRYSCFDGTKLPDDEKGTAAREWIAAHHPNEPSPDPANPAGYECINYYECVLDAAQQEKYRLRKGKR